MSILDLIDHSLRDNTVGPDAVRWTPDGESPEPGRFTAPVAGAYMVEPGRDPRLRNDDDCPVCWHAAASHSSSGEGGGFACSRGTTEPGVVQRPSCRDCAATLDRLTPEPRRSMWFDKQGQPIDSERANALLGDRAYCRVALTRIRSKSNPAVDLRVSTVWLAVDYNFLGGPPILFETMVFGPGSGEPQWRWCTEQQAIAGHAQVVAETAAGVPRVRIGELEGWGGPSFLDASHRRRQINRRRRK